MAFGFQSSEGTCTLVVDGALTIQCAEDFRSALEKSLETADNVVINLERVTEMDLSSLQLLCSAHRTSVGLNKRLAIDGDPPEIFRRSAEKAGYARSKGCALDSRKDCLWMGGTT